MKSAKTRMEVTSVLEKDVKLDIERILEHLNVKVLFIEELINFYYLLI